MRKFTAGIVDIGVGAYLRGYGFLPNEVSVGSGKFGKNAIFQGGLK